MSVISFHIQAANDLMDFMEFMYLRINISSVRRVRLILVHVLVILFINTHSFGQAAWSENKPDSLTGKAHAGFDNVSKLHRFFFGENYRKEWSADTRLPVIRISSFHGGLKPVRQGGGKQTHSLRLVDKDDKEWVLRSVEKYPDVILPENLRKTFLKDIITDAMSAQHPYSALFVPVIAEAVKVPHANPVIGIVQSDSSLGIYEKEFEGRICLLEEREPGGKSVSYFEMLSRLNADNNNSFDSTTFLRARILDVFLGDWDRHHDQWRFRAWKNDSGYKFTGVPRDRDQAFYINQGFFPYIESRSFVQPFFEGFNPRIRKVGTLLYSSTALNMRFLNQFSYTQWMTVTNEFVSEITDSVLKAALHDLPQSSLDIRYDRLLAILKSRRADLPRAMSDYYYFLNRNPLIQTSDRNEKIIISDTLDNAMSVRIFKLSTAQDSPKELFSKLYYPGETREIRFFTGNGNDVVLINNSSSPIKLRFSGLEGEKSYQVINSKKKIQIYNKLHDVYFSGDSSRIRKHLSNDSLNTTIKPGNLFNVVAPIPIGGYNPDDGVLLGLSLSFYRGLDYSGPYNIKKYSSLQQFNFMHAFATSAFSARYKGEWIHVIGKADLLLQANILAPDNSQNYFGTGNQTSFIKSGNYKTYYRSRFELITFTPSLRWVNNNGSSVNIGPSFQYYSYDSADNVGRFISTPGAVQTYDSSTLNKSKFQPGVVIEYNLDRKDNRLLPDHGYSLRVKMLSYAGTGKFSRSYGQIYADVVFYKSIDVAGSLVFANRIGGGATIGNAAFYQSLFLGGQGNLQGYRQNRFSGQYLAYNNLELRLRLFQFNNYILPGQLGLVGSYDVGKVWQKQDDSKGWHHGVGGGIYFAPAQLALIQCMFSYSSEGLYPTLTVGFRF